VSRGHRGPPKQRIGEEQADQIRAEEAKVDDSRVPLAAFLTISRDERLEKNVFRRACGGGEWVNRRLADRRERAREISRAALLAHPLAASSGCDAANAKSAENKRNGLRNEGRNPVFFLKNKHSRVFCGERKSQRGHPRQGQSAGETRQLGPISATARRNSPHDRWVFFCR